MRPLPIETAAALERDGLRRSRIVSMQVGYAGGMRGLWRRDGNVLWCRCQMIGAVRPADGGQSSRLVDDTAYGRRGRRQVVGGVRNGGAVVLQHRRRRPMIVVQMMVMVMVALVVLRLAATQRLLEHLLLQLLLLLRGMVQLLVLLLVQVVVVELRVRRADRADGRLVDGQQQAGLGVRVAAQLAGGLQLGGRAQQIGGGQLVEGTTLRLGGLGRC